MQMTDQAMAYRLELQVAMLECESNGDLEGAEKYQQMLDEFDLYLEDTF